jgi:hypothetical protein
MCLSCFLMLNVPRCLLHGSICAHNVTNSEIDSIQFWMILFVLIYVSNSICSYTWQLVPIDNNMICHEFDILASKTDYI